MIILDFFRISYVFNELKKQLSCITPKEYNIAISKYALNYIDIEEIIHCYLYNCVKLLYNEPKFDFTINIEFLDTFFRFDGQNYKNKHINKYLDIYLLINKKLDIKITKLLFHLIVQKYEYLDLVEFDDEFIKLLRLQNNWDLKIQKYYKSKEVYYIIKYLYDKNLLDDNILTQMMYYGGIENIFNCLNSINFTFKESHLKSACYYFNIPSINMILNQKIKYDEKIVEELFAGYGTNYKECIEIFMQFGYVPTKEVLIKLLDRNISPKENMIKKEYLEDKDFMSKVDVLLNKYNMFPNNFNVNPNNKTLITLISNSAKLSDIKKLIKDNKIKPDIECLREACKNKANKATIKYLVETHNLQPDLTCIQNTVDMIGNTQLSYLFDLYKNKNI